MWQEHEQRQRDWNEADGENKEVDSRDMVRHIYLKERSVMRNEDDVGGRARVT